MTFDQNLPIPSGADIDPRRSKDDQAHWTCRYCGFHESGPLTTDAEARRCAAHEYRCPGRPADDVPSASDRASYQAVYAAGLRRDLLGVHLQISAKRRTLLRTLFFEFRTRRALCREIAELEAHVTKINDRATALCLDEGWDQPLNATATL